MNVSQAIPSPGGVSVFGSSMVRVEPDLASILCGVVALHEKPIEAFAEVRAAAQAVRAFLQRARLSDVASSRITLKQEFRYVQGEQRPMGYLARVGFHVLLRELDRIEEILVGLVEAGASEIGGVDLQTTQLKDLRVEARRRALEAAREKALVYCAAAGVGLGPPIHIEDLNPEILLGVRDGHVLHLAPADDVGAARAFDPGGISVGAAVQVVFALSAPGGGAG